MTSDSFGSILFFRIPARDAEPPERQSRSRSPAQRPHTHRSVAHEHISPHSAAKTRVNVSVTSGEHRQKIETSHQSHVSHVWANGTEMRQGTPGAYKSTPNLPQTPPRQATMAERKPPRCCGSSVSQRRSTMGPNLPSSRGSNLVPFPPSVPHSQPPARRMTAHHAARRHNGANNVAVSPLVPSNSPASCF